MLLPVTLSPAWQLKAKWAQVLRNVLFEARRRHQFVFFLLPGRRSRRRVFQHLKTRNAVSAAHHSPAAAARACLSLSLPPFKKKEAQTQVREERASERSIPPSVFAARRARTRGGRRARLGRAPRTRPRCGPPARPLWGGGGRR